MFSGAKCVRCSTPEADRVAVTARSRLRDTMRHLFRTVTSMRTRTFSLFILIAVATPVLPSRAQGVPAGFPRFQPSLPAAAFSRPGESLALSQAGRSGENESSHWKTGLAIGGVAGAVLGATVVAGLCGMSDTETNCSGAALGGLLLGGFVAGTIGALIGGLFPKSS